MAIGDRPFSGSPQQYQQPRTVAGQFGEGVATALSNLSASLLDNQASRDALEASLREEGRRQQRFDATTNWAKLSGQMSREQVDSINAAPANGSGLTNSRYETLRRQREEFLSTIQDPELRREYEADTEAFIQSLTTSTYGEEFKLRTNFESQEVQSSVSLLTSEVAAGRTSMEAGIAQLEEILGTTRLSEADRASMLQAATTELAAAQFRREAELVMQGRGTVREADGSDVVAAGLAPWQRGFLNATSKRESGGAYNIRYNGAQAATFDDYSDHPRVFVPGPEGLSSAAGRYMITASTWDQLVETYGRDVLPDFSPESQDRAALLLARERFNQQIDPGGWDFDTILAQGTDEQVLGVKRALSDTWVAFRNMDDAEFIAIFRGDAGIGGGGTGSGNLPDPFTDPRYAGLPYDQKIALAAQAQSTINSMQEAIKAQQAAMSDMLQAQFTSGQINSAQVQSAINSGQVSPADTVVLTRMIQEDVNQQREATRFAAAADSGGMLGATSENKAAAYQYYRRSGILQGLQNGDATAAGQLGYGFSRTGVMPDEVASLLQSMAASPNRQQSIFAMDTLASLRAKNPDMFAFSLPDNLVQLEGAYSVMKRYSPPGSENEILERLTNLRSPELVQQRAALSDQIKEDLLQYNVDTIARSFDEGLFDRAPSAPASAGSRAMLKADFDRLFQEYYPVFNDADAAAEFAIEQLRNSWTQDSTGGVERLTYLGPTAPASGYAPVNGSYDWVRQDIVQSLGLEEDAEFGLVSDAQSEGDVASGRPASYMVVLPTENGSTVVMDPNNPGQPLRVRPTLNPTALREEQRRQRVAALRGRIEGLLNDNILLFNSDAAAEVDRLRQEIMELEGQK